MLESPGVETVVDYADFDEDYDRPMGGTIHSDNLARFPASRRESLPPHVAAARRRGTDGVGIILGAGRPLSTSLSCHARLGRKPAVGRGRLPLH